MPDKQLTTASYAAGASLAAIALVYVFAPNFAIDDSSSSATRKKGVVGLRNYANDCFINSSLQVLAGLGDLRVYLIRETHRRTIEDDPQVYENLVQPLGHRTLPEWKLQTLQRGAVTHGLKVMLDALNERPIYKKSTSAMDFVKVLETAFRQRISRQQQDAQEFLQIVAERLKDEYHAGERARKAARNANRAAALPGSRPLDGDAVQQRLEGLADSDPSSTNLAPPRIQTNGSPAVANDQRDANSKINTDTEQDPEQRQTKSQEEETEEEDDQTQDEGEGFPMEGQHESHLQCQTCGYKTKPRAESFVMLTLNVPHVRSTTLSSCFDEIFKTEYIDDFKCEKCRLIHAEELAKRDLAMATTDKQKTRAEATVAHLRHAIDTDPENPPQDIELPNLDKAPKRRIARSARITRFPKILAIHLSRSIFDASHASTKNSAKVSFPETLPLGGLTDRRNYKLGGLVTHRGSHNSGHYESFRRQNPGHAPFPNTNPFLAAGVYSKSASPSSTPVLNAQSRPDTPSISTPDLRPSSPALRPQSPAVTVTADNSSTPSLASSSETGSPVLGAGSSSPRSRERSHSLLRRKLSPTSAPRDDPSRSSVSLSQQLQSPLSNATSASELGNNSKCNVDSSFAAVAPAADPETSSIRSSFAASTRSALSKISRSRDRNGDSASTGVSTPDDVAGPSGATTAATPSVKKATAPSVSKSKAMPSKKSAAGGRKKVMDRWWRISDEKVKEAKTSEVLGLQREVYILFYELDEQGLQ